MAAAVGYGLFLAVAAVRLPTGSALIGLFTAQPAVKSATAILLALAALSHPVARERRWLVAALLLSAAGDFFLAVPGWPPAFVCGLGSFLLAHLCFLGALLPLRGDYRPVRLALVGLVVVGVVSMLIRFWPTLVAEGLTVPVAVYMLALASMVTAALLARLPTIWTALGGLLFAVSDGMIGVGKFILGSGALELPIWWVYSASIVLISAGLFFGRARC